MLGWGVGVAWVGLGGEKGWNEVQSGGVDELEWSYAEGEGARKVGARSTDDL